MVGASTRWCLSPKTCPSAPYFKKQNVHRGQEALEPLELEFTGSSGFWGPNSEGAASALKV